MWPEWPNRRWRSSWAVIKQFQGFITWRCHSRSKTSVPAANKCLVFSCSMRLHGAADRTVSWDVLVGVQHWSRQQFLLKLHHQKAELLLLYQVLMYPQAPWGQITQFALCSKHLHIRWRTYGWLPSLLPPTWTRFLTPALTELQGWRFGRFGPVKHAAEDVVVWKQGVKIKPSTRQEAAQQKQG